MTWIRLDHKINTNTRKTVLTGNNGARTVPVTCCETVMRSLLAQLRTVTVLLFVRYTQTNALTLLEESRIEARVREYRQLSREVCGMWGAVCGMWGAVCGVWGAVCGDSVQCVSYWYSRSSYYTFFIVILRKKIAMHFIYL